MQHYKRCKSRTMEDLESSKSSLSRVRLFPGSSCPWDSPGNDTGVCCHFLLQGILPTQGWNLHLLHCRRIPGNTQAAELNNPSQVREVRLVKCHPYGVFRRPTFESKVQTIKMSADQERPGAAPTPGGPPPQAGCIQYQALDRPTATNTRS